MGPVASYVFLTSLVPHRWPVACGTSLDRAGWGRVRSVAVSQRAQLTLLAGPSGDVVTVPLLR